MKSLTIFSALALVVLQSCATSIKTSTVKTMDIYGSGVIQKPVVADLVVQQERVTGNATGYNQQIEIIKQKAVSDALQKSSSDVLIEPRFETETKNGRTVAIVTGYPATYSNFRPIVAEDVPLLQAGILQKAEVYTPSSTSQKKSSAGAIIGIALLVGLVAAMTQISN